MEGVFESTGSPHLPRVLFLQLSTDLCAGLVIVVEVVHMVCHRKMAAVRCGAVFSSLTRRSFSYRAIIYTAAALTISPFSIFAKNSCSSDKGCHDEVKSAILVDEARKANPTQQFDTVFSKILRKEIKADIVYEDDQVNVYAMIMYVVPYVLNQSVKVLVCMSPGLHAEV